MIHSYVNQLAVVIVMPMNLGGCSDQCPGGDGKSTEENENETNEEQQIFHLGRNQ